jgi:hypothetical protein
MWDWIRRNKLLTFLIILVLIFGVIISAGFIFIVILAVLYAIRKNKIDAGPYGHPKDTPGEECLGLPRPGDNRCYMISAYKMMAMLDNIGDELLKNKHISKNFAKEFNELMIMTGDPNSTDYDKKLKQTNIVLDEYRKKEEKRGSKPMSPEVQDGSEDFFLRNIDDILHIGSRYTLFGIDENTIDMNKELSISAYCNTNKAKINKNRFDNLHNTIYFRIFRAPAIAGKIVKLQTPLDIRDFNMNIYGKNIKFELIGVDIHGGSGAYSGHYHVYFKRNGKWYDSDDCYVKQISWNNKSDDASRNCVLLIYRIHGT